MDLRDKCRLFLKNSLQLLFNALLGMIADSTRGRILADTALTLGNGRILFCLLYPLKRNFRDGHRLRFPF